jgi:hypothetical protein
MMKRLLISIVLLVFLIPLVTGVILYQVGLSALPDDIQTPPHSDVYPQDVYSVFWFSLGGSGPIRMEPYEVKHIFHIKECLDLSSSINLSSGVSRTAALILVSQGNSPSLRRHWLLYTTMSSIWVSRNWTGKQALTFIADHSYFGHGIYGMSNAASAYFGKNMAALDTYEIAVLVAVAFAPSHYDPWCHPDQILQKANTLIERLNSRGGFSYVNLQSLPQSLIPAPAGICMGPEPDQAN